MEKPMFPFSEHERLEMFLNTANKLKIQPAMVEKDFWVYAVLDRIFGDEELARVLCFKGGTSLSKAFHLIERFSEDIDLILARHLILQNGENLKQNSRTKQDKLTFDSHLYRLSWADYENAKIGALHLMPAKHNFGALEKDYAQMQKMFFNPEATPRWEDILAYLQELENEINTAHY